MVQEQDACKVLLVANGSSCTECAAVLNCITELFVPRQVSSYASSVVRMIGSAFFFPPCFDAVTFCIPPTCSRKDELPIDWFTAFMHRFSISTLLGAWLAALG